MKNFKTYLTENPDNSTNAKGESLRWSDTNTICFSVKDNIMFWINNDTHHKLAMDIMELTGEVYTIPHGVDLETYSYLLISEEGFGRHKFDMSGRIWKDDNTVSFWDTKKEVLKYKDLLLQLFKEVGVNPKDLKYEYADSADPKDIEHIESPMKKTNTKRTKMPPKPLPAGHIPGRKSWAPHSESVDFNQYLKENPDTIYKKDENGEFTFEELASFNNKDAIGFGAIDNILFYKEQRWHMDLAGDITNAYSKGGKYATGFEKLLDPRQELKHVAIGKPKESPDKLENVNSRESFDMSGRLWTDKNLISFWNNYQVVEPYFPLIVKFLEALNINPVDVRYEFIDKRQLMAWTDLGFDNPEDRRSTADINRDKAQQHVASPLEKKNKTDVPEMKRRGKLSPAPGVQLSPGGRPVLGDSVQPFKNYVNR